MRLAFFGTPEFAVPTLDALVGAGHDVALVVSQPDRPAGRGQQLTSPAVALRARSLVLQLAQPKALRTGPFPDRLGALGLDVAVVLAYGRILPQEILDVPRLGCVNVHASLLPRWRGAAPIQAALLAGDPETGVCTQKMEATLDTGPVLVALPTPITADDTAGTLHDRLSQLAAQCAVETLARWDALAPRPQDASKATWAPKISREDGRLDWHRPAAELDRRVRAMTPWPGAFASLPDGVLKVRAARVANAEAPPGTVVSVAPLVVTCGAAALRLDLVQAAGRAVVSGEDWARGARIARGARW
jgi:methionyl-tRNA formyltransferase